MDDFEAKFDEDRVEDYHSVAILSYSMYTMSYVSDQPPSHRLLRSAQLIQIKTPQPGWCATAS